MRVLGRGMDRGGGDARARAHLGVVLHVVLLSVTNASRGCPGRDGNGLSVLSWGTRFFVAVGSVGLEGVKVHTHFSPSWAFSPSLAPADTASPLSTPLACLYSGHRERKPTLHPMTSKKLEVRPPEGPREAWRAWASRSAVVLTRSAFADHCPLPLRLAGKVSAHPQGMPEAA